MPRDFGEVRWYHGWMVSFVTIKSTSNKALQTFRRAAAGREGGVVLVEGVRHVGDALQAGFVPQAILVSPDLDNRPGGLELRGKLALFPDHVQAFAASEKILDRVSAVNTSQGVMILLPRPTWTEAEVLGRPGNEGFFLLLCGIQDPGNVGTLIRSAQAAGAAGAILLPGTADPLGPKALRSSAGSSLRFPCWHAESVDRAVVALAGSGVNLVVTDGATGQDYRQGELPFPLAFALGPEGGGLPTPVNGAKVASLRIPMTGAVESLNVAIAGSLFLFEAARRLGREG